LKNADPKLSLRHASAQTGLERYLDCVSGLPPPSHYSWDN